MAEPWTDDFAALGEQSAQDLASLASTRALLHRPTESKMRFFSNRPLLAFAIVLALVGVASGAAFAVERLFIHVDPDQSPAVIERDVGDQLKAAGVNAEVSATKSDGELEIQIETGDAGMDLARRLELVLPDESVAQERLVVQLEVEGTLTPERQRALVEATASASTPGAGAAETEAALRANLTARGFTDVTVVIADGIATVTVRVPE